MRILFILLLLGIPVRAVENTVMITIPHTNDLHGHLRPWLGWEGGLAGKTIGGFDRIASVVKQMRAEAAGVLLLDAGDALGDTMIADLTQGMVIRQLMNAVGYDALTIGNHEPDFKSHGLRDWIDGADFPVLASNHTIRATGQLFYPIICGAGGGGHQGGHSWPGLSEYRADQRAGKCGRPQFWSS